MNRGQLVKRAGLKLGINTSTTDSDPDELALLQDLANEAVVDVLLRTHCYIERGDMTLLQGVTEYRLDPVILAIDNGRGTTPSGVGPYELITQAEMIEYLAASPVGSGMRKLISIESDLLTVAPAPDTSGEVLRFWHVPRPTPMTQDTHDPSIPTYGGIPSEYHKALERYMITEGKEYDDFADYGQAIGLYEAECVRVKKRKRGKAGRGLRGARVGYPTRYRATRNDVYPER